MTAPDVNAEDVQPGKQKISGGTMNVLAQLGLLFYSTGNVTKKQFLDISRAAAAGCRDVGDRAGAGFLEALCKRLE
jgi:hypothetical protein